MAVDVQEVEVPKLETPTKENLKEFEIQVRQQRGDGRGTGNLYKAIAAYKRSMRLAESNWDQILRSVAYLNGERVAAKAESPSDVARKFFSQLSTAALHRQCEIYNVDMSAYEEIDDIVEALVETLGWNNES